MNLVVIAIVTGFQSKRHPWPQGTQLSVLLLTNRVIYLWSGSLMHSPPTLIAVWCPGIWTYFRQMPPLPSQRDNRLRKKKGRKMGITHNFEGEVEMSTENLSVLIFQGEGQNPTKEGKWFPLVPPLNEALKSS